MRNSRIVAIILTKNEEVHIARCVESLRKINSRVIVLDSGSQDATVEIALAHGCEVHYNSWVNYSTQLNYAIDNLVDDGEWIFRIDADEYIDKECAEGIISAVGRSDKNAIYLNRYICFKGKLLTRAGMSNYYMLRLWRNGEGRCEERWMDEHIVVKDEKALRCPGKLVDESLKSFQWWLEKHAWYAKREAVDILNTKFPMYSEKEYSGVNRRTRIFKNAYNRLPGFFRPWLLFFVRYIFMAGFLDGRQGYEWAFLQTLWYRNVVDMNVKDVICHMKVSGVSCEKAIEEKLDIKVR